MEEVVIAIAALVPSAILGAVKLCQTLISKKAKFLDTLYGLKICYVSDVTLIPRDLLYLYNTHYWHIPQECIEAKFMLVSGARWFKRKEAIDYRIGSASTLCKQRTVCLAELPEIDFDSIKELFL